MDAGLLIPHVERRGRVYTAGEAVRAIGAEIVASRAERDETDPFDLADKQQRLF